MYITSTEFKELATSDKRVDKAYVVIDGVTYDDSPDGRLDSIKFEYKSDSFIGGFNAASVVVDLYYEGLSDLNWIGKEIEVHAGFDGAEFVPIGTFLIPNDEDAVSTDDGAQVVTLTAYDFAIDFDFQYTQVSLPATGRQIMTEVANRNGVDLDPNSPPLLFDDFVFTEINVNVNESFSDRELVNQYAALNLAVATINRETQLTFKSVFDHTTPDLSVDGNNYQDIKVEAEEGPINSLVYEQGDVDDPVWVKDETSIAAFGLTEAKIKENVFISLMDRETQQTIINLLFTVINGYTYTPFEIDGYDARPDLDPFDLIEVLDTSDVPHIAPIMNISWEYAGSLDGSLSSEVLPETLTDYSLSGTDQDLLNMGIKVNRIDEKIDINIIKTDDLEDKTSALRIDVDEINQTVENVGFGNILIGGSGETENYLNWDFPITNDPLIPFVGLYAKEGMTQFTNFQIIEDPNSLAGFAISFFGKERAILGMWKVFNDYKYGFRVKRSFGTQNFSVEFKEYDIDREYLRSQTYLFDNPKTYEAISNIEFGSDVHWVDVVFITPNVSISNRLNLTEATFGIGTPKPWSPNADSVLQYAKGEFSIMNNKIEGIVSDVEIVDNRTLQHETRITQLSTDVTIATNKADSALNRVDNTTVKVSPEEGVEIWSTSGKGLTVRDANNNKKIELRTNGTLKAVDGLFENATITGNLTAGTIAGLGFSSSKITFPNGKLELDSANNSINSESTQMRSYSDSEYGVGFSFTTRGQAQHTGAFITGNGGIYAKDIGKMRTSTGTLLDLNIDADYINGHQINVMNSITTPGIANIGTSSGRFVRIYLQNQPNVSSDNRIKSAIQDIPHDLVTRLMEIKPKMYLQGTEWHFGYIAQDVERALYLWATKRYGREAKYYVDKFAMLHKSESHLSLLYGELAVLKEQQMMNKIDYLETKINTKKIRKVPKWRN